MSSCEAVSVVMPVRDEESHLRRAVQQVLDQSYPGELELVIAVAPSSDRTYQIAAELAANDSRIRVIDNPTGFTPAGLNLAIRSSSHDVIVRVDGHAELSPRYIEIAVEALRKSGAANVGGVMDAQGRTPLERAIAASYNSPLGLGGGGFHLADTPEGPAETVFLGVFRRGPLLEVGAFDETLHRAQDWELNYRLRQAGHLVWFDPRLRVTYRPRSSLRELARQFYRTGQWRREVIRRHPETASLRYLMPPATVSGSLVGLLAGVLSVVLRLPKLAWLLLLPASYLGFVAYATAVIPKLDARSRWRLPVVLAVMHFSWGLGFLKGL